MSEKIAGYRHRGAAKDAPRFSLVVATRGRRWQLERLLGSLAEQDRSDFEVIIADQNVDLDLADLIEPARWSFPVHHVRAIGGGASRARNAGWRAARGRTLLFPDDDSWYPPDFLSRAAALIDDLKPGLLAGRPADPSGQTINGRYDLVAGPIDRRTVWTRQVEWLTLIDRSIMAQIGGYDEAISLGGGTPWQAAEGADLMLRAIAAGATCRYEPTLIGHHEELPVATPDARMIAKGRSYGRGLGYVLRKHHYGLLSLAYWVLRSIANLVRALLRREGPGRRRYFAYQAIGRCEGWLRSVWPIASPPGFHEEQASLPARPASPARASHTARRLSR